MFKLVRNFILFALLSVACPSMALDHYINWLPNKQNLRQRINVDTRNWEREISIDQWAIVSPIKLSDQDQASIISKFNRADYFYLPNQSIRFVLQGTGIVLDFDLKSASLTRLDRTVHSGYNFSATRFYRNNLLYSVGGEGFWSYNRHITYFDEKSSKEWEILRPKNKGPEMISDGFQGYSSKDDAFYSGGSNNKNYLEDEKIEYTKEFQRFDFKNKTWEVLGNITDIIPLKEHRTIYWNGTHFIQMARDRIYIIDPVQNEVYLYKDNATYFEAGGGEYYLSGDTIKYYHFMNRGPLSVIAVNALLKKAELVGKFYEADYTNYYLGASILLILSAGAYWIYQRKRKLQPTFDSLERKLLKALMDSGDNFIPTNELNEILECGTKSQENQRRIRFMTIKQVNEKLAFYYNIKNAIERTASTEDKRLITYRLKKGVKEKIKAIL